mmetsp:Transcript_24980/g.60132  ORF Transcript_24980/g.60132 Transcript_24980/m.60132 type:complete len:362 (-) Transcript_24980:88-1173(-)
MLGNALQRQPLPRILLQQLPDQIPSVVRHPPRPPYIHPLNPPVRRAVALRLERRHPHQKLVQEHPQRPRIHLLVVLAPLDHLGGQIVEGAAQRVPTGGRGVDAPSEVGDLNVVVRTQQQILRLDVAMDDVLRMTVLHGRAQVADEARGRAFRELPARRELLVKFAPRAVFQNEVYILVVVEVTVHSQYVTMAQMGLDLDLATQLVFHAALEELSLGEDLEGDDVLGTAFPGEVDLAELAAAQGLPDFEVAQRPARPGAGGFGDFFLGEECGLHLVAIVGIDVVDIVAVAAVRRLLDGGEGGKFGDGAEGVARVRRVGRVRSGPFRILHSAVRRGWHRMITAAVHGILLIGGAEHGVSRGCC